MLNIEMLEAISNRAANSNMRSAIAGIEAGNKVAEICRPHILAQYIAQLGHESAGFRYDREVWGPTRAQLGYEGRADLGNVRPGDGSRFRGRTAIQITGRANTAAFRDWCRAEISAACPDFEADPDLMLTDPWEGLGPVWYWATRDLDRYAETGDIEMITRRINGGLNGYADRLAWYARAALVLLGFAPDDVRGFQRSVGLRVDGISGENTRGALHAGLVELDRIEAEGGRGVEPDPFTAAGELMLRITAAQDTLALAGQAIAQGQEALAQAQDDLETYLATAQV
ncbi:glycoside hydrolase family 19 protein [Chachezhania antarctica]|uniref:glycoside hydrolase family 19 protein n=1 Tax=Chachezhania antarctica TaxID=2340860 RepID=UPI000EB3A5C1|nr:glycoside hydrolase family 19 protein [Chachezhania antarctica]|tara:strand:- start:902 stop:1756 length:855 start_codon:yes stop_codon:yes gene_type:complete